MTERIPLVSIGGVVQDLPAGDTISGGLLTDASATLQKIETAPALSVLGNNVNVGTLYQPITTTNGSNAVLRESGGQVGFGTINAGVIATTAAALGNEICVGEWNIGFDTRGDHSPSTPPFDGGVGKLLLTSQYFGPGYGPDIAPWYWSLNRSDLVWGNLSGIFTGLVLQAATSFQAMAMRIVKKSNPAIWAIVRVGSFGTAATNCYELEDGAQNYPTIVAGTYSDFYNDFNGQRCVISFYPLSIATREKIQDEAFAAVQDSARVTLTYNDASNSLTADLVAASVNNSYLANMAMQRLKGRNTASTGVPEDITVSQALDWTGNTRGNLLYRGASAWQALAKGAQDTILTAGANDPQWSTLSAAIDAAIGSTRGSILYRGASGWAILAPGTAGNALVSNGAGADPSYNGALELLTANRDYYVRTDGSDSNNGLSNTAGGAFLTIQKAIDTIATKLMIGVFNVTIHIGSGTYSGTIKVNGPWLGNGTVTILGDETTPSNVVISITSDDAVYVQSAGRLTIKGMKLVTNTSGHCIHSVGGQIKFQNIEFGSAAGGTYNHIYLEGAAQGQATGNYRVSGGGYAHLFVRGSSYLDSAGRTVTITGTPAFSNAWAYTESNGNYQAYSMTFSGTATGPRFVCNLNGSIYTAGAGANYFPGNSAGIITNGGQYV